MAAEVAATAADRLRDRIDEERTALERATERAANYPHLVPAAAVSRQSGFIAGLEEALRIVDGDPTAEPCGGVHGAIRVSPHGGSNGHHGPSLGCCVCVSLRWVLLAEHLKYAERWPAQG